MQKPRHFVAGMLVLASSLPMSVSAVTIYVSPTGAATGNGTSSGSPVNLTRAKARVREININLTQQVDVSLSAGTYYLTSPLDLNQLDSGSNGYKVVWQAGDTANPPRLSGGVKIAGWTQGTGGVWYATVPNTSFRQLYVNNDRRTRARSKHPIDIKDAPRNTANDTRRLLVDPATLPAALTNITRAEVHTTADWRDYYLPISATSQYNDPRYETPLTELTVPGSAWGDVGGQVAFEPSINNAYLENARELLDEPGEWYADATNNRLYYIPRAGENMATAEVIIPQIQTVVRVMGASATQRVTDVEFRNIRIEHSTWTAINNTGLVPIQGSEFQRPSYSYLPGAVEIQNADRLTFRDNNFQNLGASGVNATQNVADLNFTGNAFARIAGGGLQVGIRWLSPSNGIPIRITVTNNLFYRTGEDYQFSVGFIAYSLRDSQITRNQFQDLPYTAVHIGDFNSNGAGYNNPNASSETGGNTLSYNKFCNFLKYLRDGGAIYINGMNRSSDGVVRPMLVSDNFMQEFWMDWSAIYSEDHSANITYQKNVSEVTLNVLGQANSRHWLYAWSGGSYNLTLGTGANTNYNTTNLETYYNPGDKNDPGRGYVQQVGYAPGSRPSAATSIINGAGIQSTYPRSSTLQALIAGGTNTAPAVNAGADVNSTLLDTVTLEGIVTDDKLPFNRLAYEWKKISGPGDISIGDSKMLKTTAAFSAPGSYVIELSVKDGALQGTDQLTVNVANVILAPSVIAGKTAMVSSTYFGTFNPLWVTDGDFGGDYRDGVWLSSGNERAWMQFDAGASFRPSRFVMSPRNGGNASERADFAILASNDYNFTTFTVLVERGYESYPANTRWTGTTNTANSYRYYRAQSGGSYFSASEFQVFARPVSDSSLRVSSGGSPLASSAPITGEGEGNAFDGDTGTKWLGNFEADTWLRYNMAGGTPFTVTSYAISSANDAPDRDPKAWLLQGSSNGSVWNTVDSRSNQTFAGRFITNTYAVTTTGSYRFYRLKITELQGGSPLVQLSEFALFSSINGPVTPVSSGGIAAASSAPIVGEQSDKAFDSLTSTKWLGDFSADMWLRYEFGSGIKQIVTRYEVTSANDEPARDPKDWILQGSYNGIDWTPLDTRTGQTFASFFTTNTYQVAAPGAYAFYRLKVNAINGTNNRIQLSELKLYGGG